MSNRKVRARLSAALAAVAVLLAACGGEQDPDQAGATGEGTEDGETAEAEITDTLVVSYNSPVEWANWGQVLKAFTEQTGVEAPSDPKNSGQTIAALEAEAANPQADTAYYGIVFGIQAAERGLVEPYQGPNFDEIPAELKAEDGSWFTVHQGAIAFLVNTDELGGAPVPECWEDLTDPQYDGLVGFLDPTQAAVGYSVMTAANLALGGSLDDWSPGLEWASTMRGNGLALPAQTATAAVQQGEIPILIDADFNGYKLANDEGAPIEVVLPCEGTIAIPYVMSLIKDAPHPDGGKALLDFALSDEGQALFAESYLRPVRDVEVPSEIADAMLPADQYAERVQSPDFAEMNATQEAFNERWNAEVAG
ncbi:MAG: extracellular solute-binding protein [Actinobacteria bacterium]|nr:extracellular solute-binding protein [Actinomycetota bacterium]